MPHSLTNHVLQPVKASDQTVREGSGESGQSQALAEGSGSAAGAQTAQVPGWRKGQLIFNFLEWLRIENGYAAAQSSRMADPFHIQDADWDWLWKAFLEFLETQSLSTNPATGGSEISES